MTGIWVPKRMKVIVTSCGGEGTTYLMRSLVKCKISLNHKDDKDGLKLTSVTPISFHGIKFILKLFFNFFG